MHIFEDFGDSEGKNKNLSWPVPHLCAPRRGTGRECGQTRSRAPCIIKASMTNDYAWLLTVVHQGNELRWGLPEHTSWDVNICLFVCLVVDPQVE